MNIRFVEFNNKEGKIMFNLSSILAFWWDAKNHCTIIETSVGKYSITDTYNKVCEKIGEVPNICE